MMFRTAAIGLVIYGLGLAATQGFAAEGKVWRTDFEAAIQDAERQLKPLLIHFGATWCGPCQMMERGVFSHREAMTEVGERFVAVKVDNDQRPDLVQRFGVKSLPTDMVVDPTNGKVIALSADTNIRTTGGYLTFCRGADGKFQQAHATAIAAKNKPTAPLAGAGTATSKTPVTTTPETVAATTAPAATAPAVTVPARETKPGSSPSKVIVSLGDPQPIVGLGGYCPVTLSSDRKWQRGSSQFSWEHRGVNYQFLTEKHRDEFKRDPERFAPRFLGCDAVRLWETDRAIAGLTQYAAFYDDELYLFESQETRTRFKADPTRYMRTQHVLRPEEILRTAQR